MVLTVVLAIVVAAADHLVPIVMMTKSFTFSALTKFVFMLNRSEVVLHYYNYAP